MQPLRFGLIGLGHFGKHYIRLLATLPGVELVSIADQSNKSFTKHQQIISSSVLVTTSSEKVINNSNIDAVIIATPASTHKDLILQTLQAGKHVFVEKPMVVSDEEAVIVKKQLEDCSQTFMVGYQYIFNDYIIRLKQELPLLGKIISVIGQNLYFGPLRNDIGCFVDAGCHDLSIIEYLFSPGVPEKIGGSSLYFSNNGHDDFTSITLKFLSGLKVSLTTCWIFPEKTRRFIVVGEKGIAIFDDLAPSKLVIKNFFLQPNTSNKNYSRFFNSSYPDFILEVDAKEPLRNELEHFISSIKLGQKPLTGIDFGVKITQTSDTILRFIKNN